MIFSYLNRYNSTKIKTMKNRVNTRFLANTRLLFSMETTGLEPV
nr:MAG TPA: hypothetical protein [Caudoviricetes sp.]